METENEVVEVGYTEVTIQPKWGSARTIPAHETFEYEALQIDQTLLPALNAAVKRSRSIDRRDRESRLAAMKKCKEHSPRQVSRDLGYSESVAVHPYTDEEPRAHGGVRYLEQCEKCTAVRWVNENQGWYEYGTWHIAGPSDQKYIVRR